jgi:hypothetical protein
LVLSHPLTRVSLGDLQAWCFSSVARQRVFGVLTEHKEAGGEKIAQGMGEYADYAKTLLLIAEHEFAGLQESSLHFQAFSLASSVLAKANVERKAELNAQIKEAEAAGDFGRVEGLMQELQEVLAQEA